MSSNPEYLAGDDDESSSELQESAPSTLAIITQSEHAAMVATANLPRNKRKIEEFMKTLMIYATHSAPVALTMFYSLPRANKQIIGASVRFAEVVAPCWKNNSAGSRLIGQAEKTITAQGVFLDYENNVRNVKEIPRRITDKDGRTFNDDMVMTTGKAALSIAYREAILKGGVPMALWSPSYEEAKLTAVGKAMSHTQRVDAAMEYLHKLGVTEWQICNAVGVTSPKDMGVDEIVTLRTLCEEIKKQVKTIEEIFGSEWDKEIESLMDQLKMPEAQRGLLRTSYRGKAKDLVENLRSRLGPATQAKTAETTTEKKKDAKPKNTNPKTNTPPAAADQQPTQTQQEQTTTQAEPGQATDPQQNAEQGTTEQNTGETLDLRF